MNPIEQKVKSLEEENKKLRADLDKVMQYTTSLGGSLEFKNLVETYAAGTTAGRTVSSIKVTDKFGFVVDPIVQRNHVADPTGGVTVDAQARTAINSILATLEAFGFHKTS